MSNDYFMKITEVQQKILNQAIELVKKYDKEKYSGRSYFFTYEDGCNIDTDENYDCCNNENCIDKTIKKIKKIKKKKKNLKKTDIKILLLICEKVIMIELTVVIYAGALSMKV